MPNPLASPTVSRSRLGFRRTLGALALIGITVASPLALTGCRARSKSWRRVAAEIPLGLPDTKVFYWTASSRAAGEYYPTIGFKRQKGSVEKVHFDRSSLDRERPIWVFQLKGPSSNVLCLSHHLGDCDFAIDLEARAKIPGDTLHPEGAGLLGHLQRVQSIDPATLKPRKRWEFVPSPEGAAANPR